MMMDLAVKVTALLGAAWVVAFLLRGRAASTRHAVWIGLMSAALVLPLFAALAPPIELAWLPADAPGISRPHQASGRTLDAVPQGRVGRSVSEASSLGTLPAPVAPSARPAALTSTQLLFTGWFAVAVLLVLRLIASHVQARRVLASCSVASGDLAAAVASVSSELGVGAPPVRVARTAIMPAVIGILRPSIVLPADAASWTAERLRVVLLHECAHVRRRDALLQVISSVATAAYWWHPLSWLAARRIVRERELACDDLVIASGTSGAAYAQHLLDIARTMRHSNQRALASLAMARPSELEGRLIALLEDRPRNARPARAMAIGVGLALGAVAAIAPLKLVARAVTADTLTENIQAAPAVHVAAESRAVADVRAVTDVQADVAQAAPQPVARAQSAPVPVSAPVANPAFTSALVKAMDDEDADIRRMALLGLMKMDHPDLRTHVGRALQDNSDDVRTIAVMALRKLDHPERRGLLLRAAADESDDVRTMAALALGDENGADVDAMLVTLSNDASPDVRRAALMSMARKSGGGGGTIERAVAEAVAQGVAGGISGGIAAGITGGIAGALEARFGKPWPVRKQ